MFKIILATIFMFSGFLAQAQEAEATSPAAETKHAVSSLGQRKWFVDPTSILSLMIGNKYKPDQGQSRSRNGHSVDIVFGYNFSEFEMGPILRYSNYDYDTSTETSTGLGLFADFNLTENTPGAEFVPFFRASYLKQKDKDSVNSNGNGDESEYNIFGFAAGLKWFPVGDFFAVRGLAEYYQNNATYKEDGFQDFDYTISGPRVRAEFAIYF